MNSQRKTPAQGGLFMARTGVRPMVTWTPYGQARAETPLLARPVLSAKGHPGRNEP